MPQRKGKDRRFLELTGRFPEDVVSPGSATGSMVSTPILGRRKHAKSNEFDEMPWSPTDKDELIEVQDPQKLMQSSDFSLDSDVPMVKAYTDDSNGKGFLELSARDRNNFLLLVFLYFLQGIPLGLAMGSVPFLLKSHLSYSQIGIYSLATYPYSLKLLWSPIVDALWNPRLGRRLSWILPAQTVSGMGMIWLGANVENMIATAGGEGSAGVWRITFWWFSLVVMCATQDIAVDGWAITLLAPDNLTWASSAQTVGLTAGNFLSYTVFLALNSKDFANKWVRSTPQDTGLVTIGGYLTFFGWVYLISTVGLALFKREDRTKVQDGIVEVYSAMASVLRLRSVQTIALIHVIAKIGFKANDAVTNLKLLDKGLHQEDLALTSLIDFPIEIGLGYYAGKWSEDYGAIPVWCWAFIGRLAAAVCAQIVVWLFPTGGAGTGYLIIVILQNIYSTFMGTVMFVAICAFHAKIADPMIGGTYMTMLATMSNLGDTFPKIFVLKLVDAFTVATCEPPTSPPRDLKHALITEAFSCSLELDKRRCIEGGGTCNITTDGYYIVNIMCIVFGVVAFYGFIRPAALRLGKLRLSAWRVQ